MNNSATRMRLRIERLRDLTPTVREFELTPVGPSPRAVTWGPGGHLRVFVPRAADAPSAEPLQRHYSLVGCGPSPLVRIAVKRMDGGAGGSLAMWSLRVGDTLDAEGPIHHFQLDWRAQEVLLVAGGIGVTPLVGMAQSLAQRGADVRMWYGVRSTDEGAYADDLRAALGERLQIQVGGVPDLDTLLCGLGAAAQVYVCGPAGLLAAARLAWCRAGRPAHLLRFESFGAAVAAGQKSFVAHVPRHGLSLQVPRQSTLLGALENAGIEVLSDCRRGECGLCAMDVLSVKGVVEHRDVFLTEQEKADNRRICVCVSRVDGEISLDTAWRESTPQRVRA